MDSIYLFYPLLFIVALLYASVGHGGASGYLALMAIFSMTPEVMKPTALLLNLFVSAVSFLQFYRGGHFNWKLFWPFAAASIPLAFLGGMVHVDGEIYKKMLGVFLLIPVARFLFVRYSADAVLKPVHMGLALLIGGAIGLMSGLIGIGGGIILSPVILLLGWGDQKRTAAVSALFIFVNSLSGLAGQLSKGIQFSPDMAAYVGVAFAGGMVGAYMGSWKFRQQALQYVLAAVLLVAAGKLFFV